MKDFLKIETVRHLPAERESKRCKRCHRIIDGVGVQDASNGRVRGPYHPRCAPSFRARMEVK